MSRLQGAGFGVGVGLSALWPVERQWNDSRYYWEWDIHEDILFSYRANFFLVAESMLFGGVAVILSGTYKPLAIFVSMLLCFVGLYSSVVWWSANRRQHVTVKAVKDRLARSDPRSREVWDIARRAVGGAGSQRVVGVSLPSALFVVWAILLLALFARLLKPRLW